MEHSLDQVKPAVKQLLSKLRLGDAATLVGSTTRCLAAERENTSVPASVPSTS